jgi:hypothetical protein
MKKQASRIATATLVTLAAGLFAAGETRDCYQDTADAAAQLNRKAVAEMVATPPAQGPSIFDPKGPVRGIFKGVIDLVARRNEERERAKALSKNIKAEEGMLARNGSAYSHLG